MDAAFDFALTRMCQLHQSQFEYSQDLLLHIVALREVLKDRGDKDFESDHQKKIAELKRGSLGKQIALDNQAFGQAIADWRSQSQ